MKFGKLRLKNYGPFKKATIDLDRVGITHIQAQNKDAEDNNGKDTNGAGKSVLFGGIPELHWNKSPTGKDKNTQPSVLEMEYKDVGPKKDTYAVRKKFSGKDKGFRILRNGEDLNVRTIALAEKRAAAILGMGEQDFYTRVYIDSLVPHPLIVGTAAHRQEFFVDMFGLHSADSVRKLLLADYREAQQNRAAYLEVRSMFEDMRSKAMDSEVLGEKQAELQTLEEQQALLLRRFRKTQEVRDLLLFEKDNADLILRLDKVLENLDDFDDAYADAKRKLRKHEQQRELVQAWAVYDKEMESYKAKSKPLHRRLEELLGTDWMSQIKDVRDKATKAREVRAEADSLRKEFERLEVGDKPEAVEEPKHTYEKCVAKLAQLEEELEHAKSFHDGRCPTCGSKVKARPKDEISEDRDKWKARRSEAKRFEKSKADLDTWKKASTLQADLKSRLEAAASKADTRQKWIEAEDLVKRLPELPEPPAATRDVSTTSDEKIAKLQKRIHLFRTVKPVLDKIRQCAALTDEQREKAASFDKLGDRLTQLNNDIAVLAADINAAKSAHQQLQLLANRGKSLKKKAADAPILKALIDIHSNKGLKKLMIERCAKRLQDQINKFRKLYFSEDFSFEFKYGTKLEFLVHRKIGKYTTTTDVRKQSGAEKRLFTILLVVATVTMTPKNKRTNLLVLDEPEANLGPARQAKFVKSLAILNKIFPHIVVLSPRTDLEIPGAKIITVVKHQGVATLKEGTA